MIVRIRRLLAEIPELTYSSSRPTLFSFKTPIEVEIFGYELESLRSAAELVAERLGTIDGLSDIRTSTQLGNPEIRIRFQRERLARLGLDEEQVSNILRNKIRGDVATRFREGDRQIDILVRAQESSRQSVESIPNLIVNG